jgi:hypothetical protein
MTIRLLSSVLFLFVALHGAASAQTPDNLNILWRVKVGAQDYMSTFSKADRDLFPSDGQVFYLYSNQVPGTIPVYRLSNGWDHMDSTMPVAGFTNEGPLGYAFTTPQPGAVDQLIRGYNTTNGDHSTRHQHENFPPGYVDEPMGFYGFRRFNHQETTFLTSSSGGVTVNSNLVTGGAIWELYWNGLQFLNGYDSGRLLQTDLQIGSIGFDVPEAGGYGLRYAGAAAQDWQGAPVKDWYASGNAHVTVAYATQFVGGGSEHPQIWTGADIGKELTFDFEGMGSVIKYVGRVTLPWAKSGAVLEFPMIYLRKNFNRFWEYDAQSDFLSEVTRSVLELDGCHAPFPGKRSDPNYGGVLISTADMNYALGIYAASLRVGGDASGFVMWHFWCSGDGEGQFSNDTSKLDVVYDGNTYIPAGLSSYTSWVVVGSVTEVKAKMRQLYLNGLQFPTDGDSKSDVVVYRSGTGKWLIRRSTDGGLTQVDWGCSFCGDVPVPADYDGDGFSDVAVYRTGEWFIRRSSDGATVDTYWGCASCGDIPVSADYDGDGRADIAVYRPTTGQWFILRSSDGGLTQINWGCASCGDIPVPADYDGDRRADIAVYRPTTGQWFIFRSSDGGLTQINWGCASCGDIPVPADYDGDRRADIAVYRPSTAEWFILRSSDGGLTQVNWGCPACGDIPVSADYDGDGRTDIAVYRPSTAEWFILRSSEGYMGLVWGTSGQQDRPVKFLAR